MKKEFTTILNNNKAIICGVIGFIIGWCIIIPIIFMHKSGTPQAFAVGFYISLLFLFVIIFVYAFANQTKFILKDDCVIIINKYEKKQIYYNDIDNFNLLMGYVLRVKVLEKNYFFYFATLIEGKAEQKKYIQEITDILLQNSLKKSLFIDKIIYIFCCAIFPIILCSIAFFI